MSNTAPATDATPTALAAAVRRRQNLQVAGTFAGLVALVLVLNIVWNAYLTRKLPAEEPAGVPVDTSLELEEEEAVAQG